MRLRGMPNRFIMTPRYASGTYLERNVPMSGKYIPTHASNAKKAATRGASAALQPTVAEVIASAASPSSTTIASSGFTPRCEAAPNAEEPIMQQSMKHEKTFPNGTLPLSAVFMAGGHCSTNIYIAPSKRACTAPTSMMRRSALSCRHASLRISVLLSPSELTEDSVSAAASTVFPPEFSRHVTSASAAPTARKMTDNSKGAVGPRWPATKPASCPAMIATIESPK
mmetsp:Transcript_46131/g.76258  ORF Transcript_46131/g.76258 Transcript_46131/m.76258 type:complete len:226 (-) Transcript_46131:703-1380(-)